MEHVIDKDARRDLSLPTKLDHAPMPGSSIQDIEIGPTDTTANR